jgi:hypothetical protein
MAPTEVDVHYSHPDGEDFPEKPTFNDGDKALYFLRNEAQLGELELIDEGALLRKIDFMIV